MSVVLPPFPRAFYVRCLDAKVSQVVIRFSRTHGERWHNVFFNMSDYAVAPPVGLRADIDAWAYDNFDWQETRTRDDHHEYGDDLTYDLARKSVSVSSWYMERRYDNSRPCVFQLEADEPEHLPQVEQTGEREIVVNPEVEE